VKRKTFQADVRVKSEAEGRVEARFATVNVIDHDGDVILNGAIDDGTQVVISAYGHRSWQGELPVGRGTIHEIGNELRLRERFFLEAAYAKDAFVAVRELDSLGQWSFGFDILDASPGEKDGQRVQLLKRLKVYEVSPVLLGAGINTATLSAKGASPADLAALHRRSLASLSRASIALASLALADHSTMDPKLERLAKADAAVERRYRLEIRGRL
jgi:hypothetical protein